jgi:hypothetical protein
MTPKQLRELADLVEKGDALAEYHITVDAEDARPMVGETLYKANYYVTRRFVDSRINITVRPLTEIEWQDPVTRQWRSLERCKP